jgi:hypothetical protein
VEDAKGSRPRSADRHRPAEGCGNTMNSLARLVSPDSRRTQRGPQPRCNGATETTCAVAPLFSSAIASVSHHENNFDSANQTLEKAMRSTAKLLVNLEDVRSAIPSLAAQAVTGTPAKVISLATGLEVSTVYHMRQGRNQPRADHWEAVKKWAAVHRPDVARLIDAVLSGEATPAQINDIIRLVQK